ncbi:MAG TPA: terminase family protein [Isosphaeraceae bacterium]|nr:terminase family protein [Isosphaeraceae bacterium]
MHASLESRLARVEAMLSQTEDEEAVDPSQWDWYGSARCSCGLEPGDCTLHPRARPAQRPPQGNWRKWAYIAGRGAGKTKAGSCWVQHRVEAGVMRLGGLIAPTAADIRDVMVEGPSGLLSVAPPWCRPVFEPSKRRVAWPNGARAVCLSGEEPERCRGLNIDTLWADELACWQRAPQTWDLAMLALRAGGDPRAMITTTPRRVEILKRILGEPTTVTTRESTYANRVHLPPEFVEQIVALYENTRLGRQEIHAELVEVSEGAWFPDFGDESISTEAEYRPGLPVRCAIDAGTSRHTAAVFFQLRPTPRGWSQVVVFGEYHAVDLMSGKNAEAIRAKCVALCHGPPDLVRIDPAATARSSLGPTAYGEYERVFGRTLERWPQHRVLDGLDQIGVLLDTKSLLIHPRCTGLIDAFRTYCKIQRRGEWIDFPEDGHPEEDYMDALRGGVRDAFPEGRAPSPQLRTIHARRILG